MIFGNYEILLVVISFVIATIASYTALELAGRVTPDLPLKVRLSWIVAGAIAMGTGIWSMHFIAMLALKLPISVEYDLKITLLSWGDAIIASGLALLLFSRAKLSIKMLFGGSVVMGLAIASMHYLGMAGMQMSQATIHYNQWLVALSVVIAILASGAALWLAFYFRNQQKSKFDWLKLSSALVMGIAISGMHYTGMWGTNFIKLSEFLLENNERSPNSWLAIQIGIATFLILVATLIISLLDRRYTEQLMWQTALKESAEREKALSVAIQRMRQTLDIDTIFAATTSELRQVIGCDRVVVYRFNRDWSGEFVAESVADKWTALRQAQTLNPEIQENVTRDNQCIFNNNYINAYNLAQNNSVLRDTYLQNSQGGIYSQGITYRVVEDIYSANFNSCYIALLEKLQAKSYVIVSIYAHHHLWGLLAVYQNSAPRQWQETEINMIVQISSQLGIALEHVELLEQTKKQSILLEQEIQVRLDAEAQLNLQKQQLEQALSERKQLQTQLIQNEKMVALGQLVAGIAHEINNPLNFISGNLDYLNQDIEDLLNIIQCYQQEYPEPSAKIKKTIEKADLNYLNQDLQKSMDGMCRGIDRIQNLVICLRNFSRLDEAEFKLVDIHEGIESTLIILQHRLQATPERPAIIVIKNYDVLPLIECYPSQLNQVFMNILVNAIDALEDKMRTHSLLDDYTISIETKLWDNYIEIRIGDNGLGIDEKNVSKIFDPFFTTKAVGKGTGLGLSISYQIITQQHGGTLTCKSVKGEKSEFMINIPTKNRNCHPKIM